LLFEEYVVPPAHSDVESGVGSVDLLTTKLTAHPFQNLVFRQIPGTIMAEGMIPTGAIRKTVRHSDNSGFLVFQKSAGFCVKGQLLYITRNRYELRWLPSS
jgi:hypothetical protein